VQLEVLFFKRITCDFSSANRQNFKCYKNFYYQGRFWLIKNVYFKGFSICVRYIAFMTAYAYYFVFCGQCVFVF